MSLAVDNPIINSPFEEPTQYWDYKEGQPVLTQRRRPAGYYLRPRTRGPQLSTFEEEFVPIELVNNIRERVKIWHEKNYPGVTQVTRQLLNYWNDPERERKLFFCQREAAETLIWLLEASPAEKQSIFVPKDESSDSHVGALIRYACKMATGSGKTVVMGMVIAWQVLNKLANPQDRRYSDAILLVCPNLTIRERLQVLLPWNKKNYYDKFDLVPRSLIEKLHQSKYLITDWHLFQPQDDSRSRSVVQRGAESDRAFCNRMLKELGGKQNLLVINDEAHHAYRPAPLSEEHRENLSPEEIAEREEATVWVSGLEKINAVRGINFCADFSATPFFIKGSGYDEGAPFPWIISDFGLVDAIPFLRIDPTSAPTEVVTKPAAGYRIGRPDRLGPGLEVMHDRNPFHREKRLQASVYEIAAELTHRLKNKREDWNARHILFPQVMNIVWEYLEERVVVTEDIPLEEVALLKYKQRIIERLTEAIEPEPRLVNLRYCP
jgi:type III restriction enzyme